MGIHTPLHVPCHFQIEESGRLLAPTLLSPLNTTKEAPKKRVSFDGKVRVQMIESSGSSCSDDDDFWDICTSKRATTTTTTTTRTRRSNRWRKQKVTVQKVLAQQAMEQRETGSVNPDSLADVSMTTSSIFAEEAHMAALQCALEVEEYLYSDSSESEASDFEDILL